MCAAWTTKSARRAAGLMCMYEVVEKCAAKACVLHDPSGILPWATNKTTIPNAMVLVASHLGVPPSGGRVRCEANYTAAGGSEALINPNH
jgi:hypothetical protein